MRNVPWLRQRVKCLLLCVMQTANRLRVFGVTCMEITHDAFGLCHTSMAVQAPPQTWSR